LIGAQFDAVPGENVDGLGPGSWGINPGMDANVTDTVPDPASQNDPLQRQAYEGDF